ncbi:MAG: hypothetical protein K2X81_09375 [Candidatus Obscuribacterales bacterium]|nr:hypothetical protein [Candidatus Obscuribacterales bacterium]
MPCSSCSIVLNPFSEGVRRPRKSFKEPLLYWCEACRELEETVGQRLERTRGARYLELNEINPTPECFLIFPKEKCLKNKGVPFKINDGWLHVVMVNPLDLNARAEFADAFPDHVVLYYVCEETTLMQLLQ